MESRLLLLPASWCCCLNRGPDVLVHVEQIFGIILGLDIPESRMVRSEGGGHLVLPFIVAEVIDITARCHEGCQRLIGFARPRNAFFGVRGRHPLSQYRQIVALGSMWKRRGILGHAAGRTVKMFK